MTVFLVLTYILLSISVWVKAVETSERAYSEFYKESTVELAIEQITPAKVDKVTSIMMNRALFRLNDYSIDNEVKEGPAGDENGNIRHAMYSLLMDGTANGSLFKGGNAMDPETSSSLNGWVSNLNASLLAIGVYVSDFSAPESEFTFNQTDINTLDYSLNMTLKIRDISGISEVSRPYQINGQLDISGLVDPALARESKNDPKGGEALTVYRQFFFNKEDYAGGASSAKVSLLEKSEGGQGWYYGHLASVSNDADVPSINDIPLEKRSQFILVGNFSQIYALGKEVYDGFGGFILTDRQTETPVCQGVGTFYNEGNTFNPIVYSGLLCDEVDINNNAYTEKPFVVAVGFNPDQAGQCPQIEGINGTGKCALIVASYLPEQVAADPTKKNKDTDGTGVFDLEKIRDVVMCAYYLPSSNAPSYLQRLMDQSYSRKSPLGIETFVIGQYANSTDLYDTNSRLDRELFNGNIEGIKIRGLTGCRDPKTCSGSPPPSTGVFAASNDTIEEYGLGDIACKPGTGCD